MYWTRDGVIIAQLDDVWQDWIMVDGQAWDIIRNCAGERWFIRQTGGLVGPIVIGDLLPLPIPPDVCPSAMQRVWAEV
jgi:hypothetical protein